MCDQIQKGLIYEWIYYLFCRIFCCFRKYFLQLIKLQIQSGYGFCVRTNMWLLFFVCLFPYRYIYILYNNVTVTDIMYIKENKIWFIINLFTGIFYLFIRKKENNLLYKTCIYETRYNLIHTTKSVICDLRCIFGWSVNMHIVYWLLQGMALTRNCKLYFLLLLFFDLWTWINERKKNLYRVALNIYN